MEAIFGIDILGARGGDGTSVNRQLGHTQIFRMHKAFDVKKQFHYPIIEKRNSLSKVLYFVPFRDRFGTSES